MSILYRLRRLHLIQLKDNLNKRVEYLILVHCLYKIHELKKTAFFFKVNLDSEIYNMVININQIVKDVDIEKHFQLWSDLMDIRKIIEEYASYYKIYPLPDFNTFRKQIQVSENNLKSGRIHCNINETYTIIKLWKESICLFQSYNLLL